MVIPVIPVNLKNPRPANVLCTQCKSGKELLGCNLIPCLARHVTICSSRQKASDSSALSSVRPQVIPCCSEVDERVLNMFKRALCIDILCATHILIRNEFIECDHSGSNRQASCGTKALNLAISSHIFPKHPKTRTSSTSFDRSDDWKMHQGMPLLTERIWWRSPFAAIYKPCRGVPSDSWLVMTGLNCALCALVHCAGMAIIERGTQHAVWTCFFPCLFRRAVLCLLVKWHDVSAYFLGLHFILNRLLQLAWECCEAGKRIQLLQTCDMSHINGIFLTAVPSLSLGWGCILIKLVFIMNHDFCSLAGGRSKARYGCRVSARGYGSPSMKKWVS